MKLTDQEFSRLIAAMHFTSSRSKMWEPGDQELLLKLKTVRSLEYPLNGSSFTKDAA